MDHTPQRDWQHAGGMNLEGVLPEEPTPAGKSAREGTAVPDDIQSPLEKYREELARFAQICQLVKDATAEEKLLKQARDRLGADLIDSVFAQLGTNQLKLPGLGTIYIHSTMFASAAGTSEELCAALKEAGAEDLVKEKVNANSLSAYVREMDTDELGQPILPPELEGAIRVGERTSLRFSASK